MSDFRYVYAVEVINALCIIHRMRGGSKVLNSDWPILAILKEAKEYCSTNYPNLPIVVM